jgi:OHS family lactose permease-like MFS transporter
MYAIWLSQAASLNGEDIGIVFSINAAAAISLQPLLGFIQDKLKARQHILWLNVFTLLLAGPFFDFLYQPLLVSNFYAGVAVGALFVALVFQAIAGAVETYIERISRFNNLEFGQIRTWGSIGWACAAFFTGQLLNIDPELNFWFASGIALLPLVILLVIKIPVSAKASETFGQSANVTLADLQHILGLRQFHYLALYVFGVASIYVIYDQQFPVYFASVFSNPEKGTEMYGYLNSAQIFLEAGGFFLAPFLINKIGPKNGLLLAGAIMVLRIFGSGVTDSTIAISAIKLLHALELPILMVSMFKYLNFHFDSHLSSTLYLVGFALVTQLGTIALSPLFGRLYDTVGFAQTYLIMGSISLMFLMLSSRLLLKDNEMVENASERQG